MTDLSMTEIWDDTRRFVSRELGLLLPLGFATFGMGTLLLSLAVPEHPAGKQPELGMWMLWMIPAGLMVLTGYLAMSIIALRSRITVAEAIEGATKLLPRAIILMLMVVSLITFGALVMSVLAGIVSLAMGLGQQGAVMLSVMLMVPPLAWLSVRLAVLWPVLADQRGIATGSIARAFLLTKGHGWRIAALLFLNMVMYTMLSGILELAGGSVLMLVARFVGRPEMGSTLVSILLAAFNAIYAVFWSVMLVRLYEKLARQA